MIEKDAETLPRIGEGIGKVIQPRLKLDIDLDVLQSAIELTSVVFRDSEEATESALSLQGLIFHHFGDTERRKTRLTSSERFRIRITALTALAQLLENNVQLGRSVIFMHFV